jgi:hypothetical protein
LKSDDHSSSDLRGGGEFFFFDGGESVVVCGRIKRGESGVLKKKQKERYAPPQPSQENKNYTIRFFRIYVVSLSAKLR